MEQKISSNSCRRARLLAGSALSLILVLNFLACSLLTPYPAPSELSQRLAEFPVTGLPLKQEATIYWNQYQVPFIEAKDDWDAAFCLGLVHAHLRLAQIDFMRRAAQGRLAQAVGPFAAATDEALRILNLGAATRKIVSSLPAETKALLEAYVSGLNFYIEHLRTKPHEFELLRIEPQPWSVDDVVTLSRMVGADVNWIIWFQLLPLLKEPQWPEFWLRLREIHSRSTPSFSGTDPAALARLADLSRSGSNSMVVSSSLTRSGAPLIASDPHVGFNLPNLWLIAGVSSPALHCVGLMFPGIPVFAVGRNEKVAWGATNMRSLSSSLYRLDSARLARVESSAESIPVRWWFDRRMSRRLSEAGPVISDIPLLEDYRGAPLALKWIGHLPSDEITALHKANRARNWSEFRDSFSSYAVSGQNFLYADVDGNIGQLLAVRLPRPSADFSASFISEPDAGWEGEINTRQLPAALNPQAGFLVSANNAPLRDLPPPFSDTTVAMIYSSNDRADRLADLIRMSARRQEGLSAAEIKRIQMDVYSRSDVIVRDLAVGRLSALSKKGELPSASQEALETWRDWNGEFQKESTGALLQEIFKFHFIQGLYGKKYGQKFATYLLSSDTANEFIKEDLNSTDGEVDRVLVHSFRQACADRAKYGRWGEMHKIMLSHPLSNIPLIGRRYSFGAIEASGSSTTIMKSAHATSNEPTYARYGAIARHVSDLADPDANFFVLLGGEDGWLNSDNFLDQVPLWQKGEYLQVPMRLETVRQTFQHVLTLKRSAKQLFGGTPVYP